MDLVGIDFSQIRKMLKQRGQHNRFLSDEDRTKLSNAIHNHCHKDGMLDVDELAGLLENTHFGCEGMTDTELVKQGKLLIDGYIIRGNDMWVMKSMVEKLTEYELEKAIIEQKI